MSATDQSLILSINFTDIFNINDNDIIGNQAPFDFDVSVKDIYSALKTGARLVVIPRKLFSNPPGLLDFICEHKITTMIWAVSALCLITTFHGLDYKTPKTVNKVMFSGEVMPVKHLKAWMEALRKRSLLIYTVLRKSPATVPITESKETGLMTKGFL